MSGIYHAQLVGAAIAALGVSSAAADVFEFQVAKVRVYEQTTMSPPAMPLDFVFDTYVDTEAGDATLVTVNGMSLPEEYSGEWSAEVQFESQAALDAAFPSFIYNMHIEGGALGVRNETVTLSSPAIYPAAPALTPASFNATQGADPSQDLLIEWNAPGVNTNAVFLYIYDVTNDFDIIDDDLPAMQTSFLIDASFLEPDHVYEIELAFGNANIFDGQPAPGFGTDAVGVSGYASVTVMSFITAGGVCDDVGRFVVVKGADYTQTADNTQPTVPDSYFFDAFIDTIPGGIGFATIDGIGAPSIDLFDFDGTGFWEANEIGIEFESKALLDATFPSFTAYSFDLVGGTFGARDQSVFMGDDDYPTIPYLVGTSYSDLQGMDAAQEITINWAPAGVGTSFIVFDIFDVKSDSEVISVELDASATSFTFTADLLNLGAEYELLINFVNGPIIVGNPCPGFGTGSEGLAGFVNGTAVFFTTMSIDDSCVIPALIGSSDTSGTARDIAIVGDNAYVADDNAGLQIFDVSDQSMPVLLSTYDTPSSSYGVFATGQTAFIADGGSGLQIVDVNDPSSPNFVGSYNTPNWAWDVTVLGVTAYVADGNAGLQIIDISDPTSPSLLGAFDTAGTARGVMIVGSTAYIADGTSGLVMINVSDPTSPTLLGSYDTPGTARGLTIDGTTAYVADDSSGLQIIDVSDPTSPFLLGSYDTPGSAFGVSINGTLAHIADGSAGLQIIEVNDPSMPIEIAAYDTAGFTNELAISGERAFLADGGSGMHIIDVTNTCVVLCPPDLTDDGTLNFFDISAFLSAFAANDPAADFDGNGTFNFFDISAFLTAFSAGCP